MTEAGKEPDVTVLVPALNEQDTIREVVDRVLALPMSLEVIVIDDGSTDETPKILAEFGDRIVVLRSPVARSGKGSAIRQGLGIAKGNAIVIQDADLEYFPEEIPALVEPILKGEASVVYGTRFLHGMPSGMALPNKLVNKMLVWAVRLLYGHKITDEATCYKAIRRDLLLRMKLICKGFEFCPEVTAKTYRLGQKIVEKPIQYVPRSKGEGKKIRWTDAPVAFWTLLRHRFWKPTFVAIPTDQIDPSEMAEILDSLTSQTGSVVLSSGSEVSVVRGPFQGYVGRVISADKDRSVYKVEINIFGRLTEVEIPFHDVVRKPGS